MFSEKDEKYRPQESEFFFFTFMPLPILFDHVSGYLNIEPKGYVDISSKTLVYI